jgi:hypothetical protein
MSAPAKETAETTIGSLHALAEAEGDCRRCPLYRDATQAVPGEGPSRAEFMLVGEQPGDKEDLAGKPFVGPAGRILDAALKDAGIPREDTFVTNAVKHFRHEARGKRRLHKRPNNYEIERCKIWLDRERACRYGGRHQARRHDSSLGAVADRGRGRQARRLQGFCCRPESGRASGKNRCKTRGESGSRKALTTG